MKTPYFCAYHVEQMKACESEALRCWSQVMQRGVKAYTECRTEAALIYLGAALDVSMMRAACPKNGIFKDLHLTKPAEFLVQLYLTSDDFGFANTLLTKLDREAKFLNELRTKCFEEFLLKQFKCVSEAEKLFIEASLYEVAGSNVGVTTVDSTVKSERAYVCH